LVIILLLLSDEVQEKFANNITDGLEAEVIVSIHKTVLPLMHQQMVFCFRICWSSVTQHKRNTDDTPTKNDATGKAIGVVQ